MAATPKPCGCDCSAMTGPCDCGGQACGVVCESKETSASLCGLSEFTPSSPPKKYRKQTLAGESSLCQWLGSDSCAGNANFVYTCKWTGDLVYSKDDCSVVDGRVSDLYYGENIGCMTHGSTHSGNSPDDGMAFTTATLVEPTKITYGQDPDFEACHPAFPTAGTTYVGGGTRTLTDEDTPDDAEGRAMAAIADWSACSGCECYAFRSTRGPTDTSWGFRNVRVKASFTATGTESSPGYSYKVTLKFCRRVAGGGGDFLFFGLIYEVTISGSTTEPVSRETEWIDVPNEEGFETIVCGCSVEKV